MQVERSCLADQLAVIVNQQRPPRRCLGIEAQDNRLAHQAGGNFIKAAIERDGAGTGDLAPDLVHEHQVEVNPRFGEFDHSGGGGPAVEWGHSVKTAVRCLVVFPFNPDHGPPVEGFEVGDVLAGKGVKQL